MKNLKTASDEDVYRMKNLAGIMVAIKPKNKICNTMVKQLEKEWKKRNIEFIPLSWDLR